MKGVVSIAIVWALILSPLAFGLRRRSRYFIGFASLVTTVAVSVWIGMGLNGYHLSENLTGSLPGYFYVYRDKEPFAKGDMVAFRWKGGASYPRGTIFIKRVVGMPGDEIRVEGSRVWVGGHYVGIAKPVSKAGYPLEPIKARVVPPGEVFVATPSVDSLDSRYELSGTIPMIHIVGRAYELI